MAFTQAELDNILNAALPYYIKGKTFSQTIQEKPLLNAMIKAQKEFSGGNQKISIPVQGNYSVALEGYTHNDTVAYQNPTNIRRAEFFWKELHAGITVTHTELKIDGISVVDSTTGANTSNHSDRDVHVLTGLLENKLDDMGESWSRNFDSMLHKDGTQDPLEVPGIRALIADDPSTGTLAGIDRATNSWWRNRSLVNLTGSGGADNSIAASNTSQTMTRTLRKEVRQLRRYGGKPSLVICGAGFLEKLEWEIQEKGVYTEYGFIKEGSTEIGMADITMRGVGRFLYDPMLDDLNLTNRAYFIDTSKVGLMVMQGEDRKIHTPARPHDQYVLYRAMTWTGALCAKQLNGCGVYEAK